MITRKNFNQKLAYQTHKDMTRGHSYTEIHRQLLKNLQKINEKGVSDIILPKFGSLIYE